jgi:hypothetical protein
MVQQCDTGRQENVRFNNGNILKRALPLHLPVHPPSTSLPLLVPTSIVNIIVVMNIRHPGAARAVAGQLSTQRSIRPIRPTAPSSGSRGATVRLTANWLYNKAPESASLVHNEPTNVAKQLRDLERRWAKQTTNLEPNDKASFFICFMVHLITLSIAWIIQRQMILRLVNNELERMLKEAVRA